MEISNYLELITTYQINTTILALLTIALTISGLFLYHTNDIKTTLISFLSILLAPILTAITLLILYEYLNIQPSEKHSLILWIPLVINTINLSTLIAKYSKEVVKKDFDIDHVTRYHFKATLNLFMTTLLIKIAVCAFTDWNVTIILLSTLVLSSTAIWFNHFVARILLRDK